MKKSVLTAIGIIIGIIIIAILVGIESLINWGLGVLIVNVFNINYTWTFMHGLCATIIIEILSSIFKRKN